MMDRVILSGIEVFAYHGVLPAEREIGQRFVIDAEIWYDCSEAARTDDLAQALDYTQVHSLVCATATAQSFQLLESLAGRLCADLLSSLAIDKVRVKVTKPHPPIPDFRGQASVVMTRDRQWAEACGQPEGPQDAG